MATSTVLDDLVGRSVRRVRVAVERGPVSAFAKAVHSPSEIYQDADAAKEAGFDRIPAPPTFAFVAHHWGAFPDLQPEGDQPDPMMEAIAELKREPGMILHGEQAFTFERPLRVGDVLWAETRVSEVYAKGGMTFVVVETAYSEDGTNAPVCTSRFTLIFRPEKG